MTWMHDQRLEAVIAALRAVGAETIVDLGCGDGPLLVRLAHEPAIRRIVGVDVSADALDHVRQRLAAAPESVRRKVELRHASMTEAGNLTGFDAAILVETIEHIEPDRLSQVERAVFRDMRPGCAIITTPNSDYNALLGVPGHRMRHRDHRFEWGGARFRAWAGGVATRNGYAVSCDNVAGGTQMAVFRLALDAGRAARA
jgi:small RNA 2'-O-methyltransferase